MFCNKFLVKLWILKMIPLQIDKVCTGFVASLLSITKTVTKHFTKTVTNSFSNKVFKILLKIL